MADTEPADPAKVAGAQDPEHRVEQLPATLRKPTPRRDGGQVDANRPPGFVAELVPISPDGRTHPSRRHCEAGPSDRQLLGVLELTAALKADLRSVAISRLPTADNMVQLGSNLPTVTTATLTRSQVRALDDKGGLAPEIEERFGAGTFLLTFVGEFEVVPTATCSSFPTWPARRTGS